MLVIISDLHLTDGTSGTTISSGAFDIFAHEVRTLAINASQRADGRYRPIEQIDILLLGDVLDLIRSSRWAAHPDVRPWSSTEQPAMFEILGQITADILRHNEASLATLRQLTIPGEITLPPADALGRPVISAAAQPVAVKLHYMVGNHDWFLHLPGEPYDLLRRAIAEEMGLANDPSRPFPHTPEESPALLDVLRRHRVFARHGDIFDPFNFEGDRNASSLGDALVIELINRFPVAVEAELGGDLPMATLLGLRELDNIRPIMLAPVWIDGLLNRTCSSDSQRQKIKQIWNRLTDEFLHLPFVRQHNTWNPVDLVDGLATALKFSRRMSLGWTSRILGWLQSLGGQSNPSYYLHALQEPDFRNRRAKYIVYGHTHVAESVPLDASFAESYVLNQIYFNSGTWRRVLRPTVAAPQEHEFIPHDVMTYLTFFQGDERHGRPYETWSGTLGVKPIEVPALRIDAGQSPGVPQPHVSAPVVHATAPHFASRAAGPVRPTRRQR